MSDLPSVIAVTGNHAYLRDRYLREFLLFLEKQGRLTDRIDSKTPGALSSVLSSGFLFSAPSQVVVTNLQQRDFVLVTDSAIGNLDWTLPAYRKAVATHAGNRALLYLLGDGVVCPRCHYSRDEICYVCSRTSRQTLVALEKAGFVPHFLQQPSVVERLLARQLRQLLP